MATGRDIHGKVVMDATVETTEAEAQLKTFFEQQFQIKALVDLPTKASLQAGLDTIIGTGLKIKAVIDVDDSSLLASIKKVDAAQAAITKNQAKESSKRITDNVRAANKTKNISDKLAADQIRLAEQSAEAQAVITAGLVADQQRILDNFMDFQRRQAIQQAGLHEREAADRRKLAAQIQTAVTKSEVAVTENELKQIEIRLTAAEKEAGLRTTIAERQLAALELLEQRTNSRIDILNTQHFSRIEAQEQASTLRREVIQAQLASRLTAQNDAFEKRRVFAAESAQRRLQAQADKPILQKILVDANALNSSLSDFDRTITRFLKTSLFAFTGWAGAVTAAVGGIAIAGAVAFAKLESASTAAASVVAAQTRVEEFNRLGKAVSDFGDVTDRVQRKIEDRAQEVALATSGFDPTEITLGIKSLLQSGQTLDEAFINIGSSANFASVNQADLLETTKGLATSLAGTNLEAENSAALLDQISFTAASAVGDVKDYFDAFANGAGSSGKIIGNTTEQTLFFLKLLGQAGQIGLTAGTSADIIFRDLGRAAIKAGDEWQKYGLRANAPIEEQIVLLADLVEQTGTNRLAQAQLRKDLGFQEKSFRALSKILPQVQKLGGTTEERLAGVRREIKNIGVASQGLVELQLDQQRDNIAFQFDQLGDTIKGAFQSLGRTFGPSVARLLDQFAGTGGLIDRGRKRIESYGAAFNVIFDNITKFVQTDAFRRGLQTLEDSVIVTLGGVRAAFREFSNAFTKGDDAQSAFESFADSILAFSKATATVLPVVASIIGNTIDFLVDHADAFETFAKITVAVYAMRKAFTLFISPALTAFNAMDKFIKASEALAAAETIGPVRSALLTVAGNLGLVTQRADAATKALRGVATAEALVDVLNTTAIGPRGGRPTRASAAAGSGLTGAGAVQGAVEGNLAARFSSTRRAGQGVEQGISDARTAANFDEIGKSLERVLPKVDEATGRFAKLGGALKGIGELAGPIAIVVAAVEAGVGIFRGFFDELDRGNSSKEFTRSLVELQPLFSFLSATLEGTAVVLLDILAIVGRIGETFGRNIATTVTEALVVLGDVKRIFQTDLSSAFAALGDVAAGLITIPIKIALAQTLDLIANTIASFTNLPFLGDKFKDAENAIRGASHGIRDFRINMSKASNATEQFASISDKAYKTSIARANSYKKALLLVGAAATVAGEQTANAFQFRKAAQTSLDVETAKLAAKTFHTSFDSELEKLQDARLDAFRKRQKDALTKTGIDFNDQADTGGFTPSSDKTGGSAKKSKQREFKDPDERIQIAIDRLKPAQKAAEVNSIITKVLGEAQKSDDAFIFSKDRLTASVKKTTDGMILTRQQTLLLAEAIPNLDKAIEKSRSKVEELDKALNDLRNTQLLGTKAFSDAAFANEQAIKRLQLAKLDAQAADPTLTDESPQLKAIDDQIKALQTQAERASLTESLQLDPLRRKLEETFSPVKEDTFTNILAQFNQLTVQQQAQSAAVAEQQAQRERLNASLERSQAHYEKIDAAAQRSVDAFNKAQEAADSAAGALSAVGASASSGAAAVDDYSTAVENVPGGEGVVTKSLTGINKKVTELAPQFAGAGLKVVTAFTQGINNGKVAVLQPALAQLIGTIGPYLNSPAGDGGIAFRAGEALMGGFLAGIKNGFGTPEIVGSIAWYLHVFIPDWIRKNKGPIAADSQILVPAGHAVMDGFGKGLRDGFGQIQGFVKEVGPSLSEFISGDAFSGRVATVMADIAIGKTPDIEGVFGDLRPPEVSYGPGGAIDPALSYLHQSLSYADTKQMAETLAKQFGMQITALRFDHNQFTSSGNVSDHFKGLAADFSNGTSPTPGMDTLAAALKPLYGKIFSQIIWRDHDLNRGFNIPGHMNHVHAAWIAGNGFSIDSGKIGKPAVTDIPGASPRIDAAISAASAKYGVELAFLAAVAKQESQFNPNASSGAADGLFQFTPATARGFGIDPFNIEQAADGGARYLKNLLHKFSGRYDLALGGYNAGPYAPGLSEGHLPPYSETINYVHKVLGYLDEFRKQFGGFRELGGGVQMGKSYVVGEGGREIFTPGQSGTITPNDQTERILNGGKQMSYTDNSKTIIQTAATDADVILAKLEAKKKKKFVGVNNR